MTLMMISTDLRHSSALAFATDNVQCVDSIISGMYEYLIG